MLKKELCVIALSRVCQNVLHVTVGESGCLNIFVTSVSLRPVSESFRLCFDRSLSGSVRRSGGCPVRFVFFFVCQEYIDNVLSVSYLSLVTICQTIFFSYIAPSSVCKSFWNMSSQMSDRSQKRYRLDGIDERYRVEDILAEIDTFEDVRHNPNFGSMCETNHFCCLSIHRRKRFMRRVETGSSDRRVSKNNRILDIF